VLKTIVTSVLALLVVSLFASRAAAQAPGAAEIGYDLGLSILMPEGDDVLILATPRTMSIGVSTVRAGFYLSPHGELEPSFGLMLVSSGGSTLTQFGLGLDYLYNFGGGRQKTRPFLMGGGRMVSFSGGNASESQFGLGGGFGAKSTIGDRAAMRYSAELVHQFESDNFAARWDVAFAIGISVFTK